MDEPSHFDGAAVIASLREWGRTLGFSQIGVAGIDLATAEPRIAAWLNNGFHGDMDYLAAHGSKRSRPGELVPGTVSVITARLDYLPRTTPAGWRAIEWRRLAAPEQATVSLYARGRDYHRVLRQRLRALAERLGEAIGPFGHRVFTDSAPVLEVELAARSGIGWRGKHTLALDRDAGSMFFLGEIYVDVRLPETPPVEAHCGSCSACIDVCPTAAILAPYELDARRCISYLTIEAKGPIPVEFRAAIGNRIYGCDDCQLVCPWNKYAKLSALPDFDGRAAFAAADAAGALELERRRFPARDRGQRDSPHRPRAVAAQPRRRARQCPAEQRRRGDRGRAAGASRRGDAAGARAHRLGPGPGRLGHRPVACSRHVQRSACCRLSQSGTLTIPSRVETVTRPATKTPSPPIRAAST